MQMNIASIGSNLEKGLPSPSVAISDITYIKDRADNDDPYLCMFGDTQGRLIAQGQKDRKLKNLVVLDKEQLKRRMEGIVSLEQIMSISWVMVFKILRLYYSTLKLRPEELLPLGTIDSLCNEESAARQKDKIISNYIKSKRDEISMRRNIDRTVVAIATASVVIGAWKNAKEWDVEEVGAYLTSRRDAWQIVPDDAIQQEKVA